MTCSFLYNYSHETNLDNYQVILVKLSAGINNLLHRENVLSDISPQQFIDKLLHFKNVIKQIVPSALVGFVTIPSANLFELHCSTQSLCVQQAEMNNKLDTINRNIRSINSSTQTGHCRGCWTVSWHLSVQKKHTKRSRKNAKPKHCTKFPWKNLYDGLHVTSEIKRIWFNQVVSAFRAEILFTTRENSSSLVYEDITSEESESDFMFPSNIDLSSDSDLESVIYTDWKRVKH